MENSIVSFTPASGWLVYRSGCSYAERVEVFFTREDGTALPAIRKSGSELGVPENGYVLLREDDYEHGPLFSSLMPAESLIFAPYFIEHLIKQTSEVRKVVMKDGVSELTQDALVNFILDRKGDLLSRDPFIFMPHLKLVPNSSRLFEGSAHSHLRRSLFDYENEICYLASADMQKVIEFDFISRENNIFKFCSMWGLLFVRHNVAMARITANSAAANYQANTISRMTEEQQLSFSRLFACLIFIPFDKTESYVNMGREKVKKFHEKFHSNEHLTHELLSFYARYEMYLRSVEDLKNKSQLQI